jgi:single-strand DNA-binding protein
MTLRIDVVGNVGSDPEVRYTQNHRELAQFSVAVNQRRQNADGQWEDQPAEWLRVRAMGPQLERARSLTRGDRVFVVGRLDITHYTSRDGESRTGLEVSADEVTNLGRRTQSENDRAPTTVGAGSNEEVEEDLPF